MEDLAGPGTFAPPYQLGGGAVVVVGLSRDARVHAAGSVVPGYRPLSLWGRTFVVIVATHISDPPPELPIRYHEVVLAVVVRRGLRLASLPIDMVLDAPEPVDLGHRYYSLPKRLAPSVIVTLTSQAADVRADRIGIAVVRRSAWLQLLSLPVRVLWWLGMVLFTGLCDVLGTHQMDLRRARIRMRSQRLGWCGRVTALDYLGHRIEPLYCVCCDPVRIRLGAPHALR